MKALKNTLISIIFAVVFLQNVNGFQLRIPEEELKTLETDISIIQYPPRLENAAQQIVRGYPAVRYELEQTLKLEVDFKPTILLMNDRRRFRNLIGNDFVVAIAVPQHDLMVIDYTRMIDNPFMLQTTLKHELSHLLLNYHIDYGLLPRWFDEGVAQWITGGMSELVNDPGWSVLERAAMRGNIMRFDELESFPSARAETMLAYQQSKSFIEYIVETYGTNALIDIIHGMKDDVSVDRAFSMVLPHNLRQVEQNWVAHIQARVTWVTYISRNIFQFIFLFASLLVIVAFIKKIVQKRRYHDDDEETGQLPSDDS
jgi:hypothetical protein